MTTTIANRIEYLQTAYVDTLPDQPVANPPILKLVQLGFRLFGPLFPRQAAQVAYRLFSTPRIRARHKTSDYLLESARVFEFLYGKMLLKGYEWGQGEKSVLLVHGWESRGTALRTFVPPLLARGYRVVAFDGPAHGDSGGRRTNLIHFAGAVRAAMRQAGKVSCIIAHSFGGAATVYALANAQEDLHLDKLVLIATPNSMERVLRETIATLKLPKIVTKEFFKFIERRLKAPVQAADLEQAFDRLSVGETLVVHDRRDPVVPFAAAEAIHAHWSNATLLVLDGYGHYRLMKNPDLTERVAAFIHGEA